MEKEGGRRQVVCESCGASFSCCPVPVGGCWCADVGLSNVALQELKAKFAECICPDCLVKHAQSNGAART